MTLSPHPNVRKCTHIKVAGHRCGSPALRGDFFCYFHTRIIKGVQQRVDMRLDSIALLEDCESIQLSIMHVVDGLVKGTLDPARARLIIQALRIAARNAKNVRFDDCRYQSWEQPMVRQVPNYARQYLIEHPEFGPPLSTCGEGAPAREHSEKAATQQESPVAPTASPKIANAAAQPEASPSPASLQNISQQSATPEPAPIPAAEPPAKPAPKPAVIPAAKRRQNAVHGASRGSAPENNPAPQERKNDLPANVSSHETQQSQDDSKERELIKRAEAAIEGATRGDWRDLRTVFEFAGITSPTKEVPS